METTHKVRTVHLAGIADTRSNCTRIDVGSAELPVSQGPREHEWDRAWMDALESGDLKALVWRCQAGLRC